MRTQEAATGTTDFSNILAQLRPGDQEATTTESSVTTTQAKHGFPDACLVIPLKLCLVAGHCGKKIKNRKRRGRGREGGKKKEEGKKKFNNSMTLLASRTAEAARSAIYIFQVSLKLHLILRT